MATNALQAVLDKAARQSTPSEAPRAGQEPAPAAKPPARRVAKATPPPAVEADAGEPKFYRPVRDGKRFVGAHFNPEIARQLRMLAAEDDTTIQALLEEAVELLFVKKGKAASKAMRAERV